MPEWLFYVFWWSAAVSWIAGTAAFLPIIWARFRRRPIGPKLIWAAVLGYGGFALSVVVPIIGA